MFVDLAAAPVIPFCEVVHFSNVKPENASSFCFVLKERRQYAEEKEGIQIGVSNLCSMCATMAALLI